MTKQLNKAECGSHPHTRLSQVTLDHLAKKCGARHKGGNAKYILVEYLKITCQVCIQHLLNKNTLKTFLTWDETGRSVLRDKDHLNVMIRIHTTV